MSENQQLHYFPACHVCLPAGTEGRSCAFYLAAEEYVAQHLPFDTPNQAYLFNWILQPTVVMGRNQVAHQEVDLDFCKREGIEVIRRKSGGGAIFADTRNIMTSLITGAGAVEPLFEEYAAAVSGGLRTLGAPTTVSGRNDITLEGGGKICGNAFYHLTNRNIVHGTMLYDTDPRLMQGALHPDVSKLKSAGVKSVRSRVALLKDYLPFDVRELRRRLITLLTDRTVTLNDDDVAAIEQIEQSYYAPEYLLGSSAHADVARGGRADGVGTLMLHFSLQGSLISDITLSGDYFELSPDPTADFRKAFVGKAFTSDGLQAAIAVLHPEQVIRNLTTTTLTNLIN